jgi:hypothetical protein
MRSGSLLVSTRRPFFVMVMMALLCGASGMRAQQAPPPAAAPAAAAAPDQFKFSNDAVLVLFQVKPEAAAEFATTWTAIKAKLQGSDKPDLKELGDSLKIFKVSAETPAGNPIIFVFQLNPPSKTMSYDPGKILYESGLWERKDADPLYAKVGAGVLAGLNVLPLAKVGG